MINLNFEIKKQKLKRTDNNVIVNKSRKIITCNFEFTDTENWEGIEKLAIFTNTLKESYVCNLGKTMTCECTIPEEAMTGKYMTMSVFGGDRITTNELIIPFLKSNYTTENLRSSQVNTTDFFNSIIEKVSGKYDNLDVEEGRLYCYSGGELKKIIPLNNLILNNYYTREYIDEHLADKYDDFNYEEGYLICSANGKIKKKIPISVIAEDYYTKKEIDEKLDEINNTLEECVVDGETNSDSEGVYLNLKTLKKEESD